MGDGGRGGERLGCEVEVVGRQEVECGRKRGYPNLFSGECLNEVLTGWCYHIHVQLPYILSHHVGVEGEGTIRGGVGEPGGLHPGCVSCLPWVRTLHVNVVT